MFNINLDSKTVRTTNLISLKQKMSTVKFSTRRVTCKLERALELACIKTSCYVDIKFIINLMFIAGNLVRKFNEHSPCFGLDLIQVFMFHKQTTFLLRRCNDHLDGKTGIRNVV